MKKNKSKLLLLIGCQRSGTTLLAAMLGGHSEINMLFESTSKDVLKLIGKKYNGNKLLAWRQIRMKKRSSKIGHLFNRIVNFDFKIRKHKPHKIRLFATSSLSIQDYIDNNAKIITIVREKAEVINSITSRTKMKKKQAENEYNYSMEIIDSLDEFAYNIRFSDLVTDTVNTLKGICEFLNLDYEERMLKGVEYNFVYPHSSIISDKSKSADETESFPKNSSN